MLYTIVNFTTQCGESRHTDIANFATLIHIKKLIHCVAIFTILYGNYYPPHGEFKLIFIGKFAGRTWVNFTQRYGKNRQRCQQNAGWGSKFGTTKCRKADISKIRNFEYWNNESRVIRFFYFRIYSLFLSLFKLFEHSKYIFDNLPSNSKFFELW